MKQTQIDKYKKMIKKEQSSYNSIEIIKIAIAELEEEKLTQGRLKKFYEAVKAVVEMT